MLFRSPLAGIWTCPRPALSQWHSLTVTMDGSSVANNPLMYVDGVSQTVTEATTPTGTFTIDNTTLNLGNRNDNVRVWDGGLAEFAQWNRILSAAEVAAIAAGDNPRTLANLIEYIPMLTTDNPITSCLLAAPTVVGTAIIAHPIPSSGCGAGVTRSILTPVGMGIFRA